MTLLGAIDAILFVIEAITKMTQNKLDDVLVAKFRQARMSLNEAREHVLARAELLARRVDV